MLGQRAEGRCGFPGWLGRGLEARHRGRVVSLGGGGRLWQVRSRAWGGVGSIRVPVSPAPLGPGFTDEEAEAGVRGEVPPGGATRHRTPAQGCELPLESAE